MLVSTVEGDLSIIALHEPRRHECWRTSPSYQIRRVSILQSRRFPRERAWQVHMSIMHAIVHQLTRTDSRSGLLFDWYTFPSISKVSPRPRDVLPLPAADQALRSETTEVKLVTVSQARPHTSSPPSKTRTRLQSADTSYIPWYPGPTRDSNGHVLQAPGDTATRQEPSIEAT